MHELSEIPVPAENAKRRSGIIARSMQIAVVFLLQGIILFASAGRLHWMWAWMYFGICLGSVVINGSILLRTHPDTIAERGRAKDIKRWDKILSGLWSMALYIFVPLIAGLNFRFEQTEQIYYAWKCAAACVLILGLGIGGWAMITNAFFSTVVRIQNDRGQTVCQTGPYKYVRHPGYVGFILQSISTPILLGSLWALLPGVIAAVSLIVRTVFEDRMLQLELSGYDVYRQKVRFRLLPGIW